MMTDKTRLPKLWIINVADNKAPSYTMQMPPAYTGFDFVCLRQSQRPCLFARLDHLDVAGSRLETLKISLADTVPVDDVFEHFSDVLYAAATIKSDKARVAIKMRVTDPTIVKLYGKLDPRWHSVRVVFIAKNFKYPTEWVGADVKAAKHDIRSHNIELLSEVLNFDPRPDNLLSVRCNEHIHWAPIRTVLVTDDTDRSPVLQQAKVVLDQFVKTAYRQTHSSSWASSVLGQEKYYALYRLLESDAVFAFDRVTELMAASTTQHSCTVHLSKQDHMHRHKNCRIVEQHVANSRRHLQQQTCGAALVFCQSSLPIYVVLWVVQWLPAMYRLKDIEIVRLIEGVYGSAKRVRERRADTNKHNKLL